MKKGNLYLCGAGNVEGIRLALSVQNAVRRWDDLILLDDDPAKIGTTVLGLPIVGPLSTLSTADPRHDSVVNLVTRKTASRWKVMEKIEAHGVPFATLVHPSIDLFGVALADGATVYQSVILGAGCTMEKGAVALVRSVVGHGARIEAGAIVAPGSIINARVTIGERAYVGSNAVVLPDLHVGADATVGALSSVLEDVPARATAIGVPAKILVMDANADAIRLVDDRDVDEELEQNLIAVWHQVLGVAVKPTDNFFELGGTSLQVFMVCRAVEESLGLHVSPAQLFQFLTVRALAAHLGRTRAPERDETASGERLARRSEFFATRKKRRMR